MKDNLAEYKTSLKELMNSLSHDVHKEKDALVLLRTYTDAIDSLLITLWQQFHVDPQKHCLIAVGGYGRKELYPYSDIDLLILTDVPIQEDKSLESFLQTLWDLKLKASPVTATQEQLIHLCQDNLYTLTSILDQRYLSGSQTLYTLFCNQSNLLLHLSTQDFFEKKWQEQCQRHQRFGVHACSLEPNIKESPGGLRDVQTLLWSWKYAVFKQGRAFKTQSSYTLLSELTDMTQATILSNEEAKNLSDAYLHLAHIRFTLHVLQKKSVDKLSFEIQPLLAEHYLGETPDAQRVFMKQYYHYVLMLNRYLQILRKSFLRSIDNTPSEKHSITTPNLRLTALLNCQNELDVKNISLETIRAIHTTKLSPEQALSLEAQTLFLKLFDKYPLVYSLLKNLHIWGALPYYLPELTLSIGLIQQSLFHRYTVDEHTLLLTKMIDKFYRHDYQEQYPLCHEIIFNIQSPQVLYLAALLHDSGKGRLEDHSLVGKKLAEDASRRLATLLNTEEQDNLIWLVEEHLLMSTVAQKQDVQNPQVIIDFAKKVKNSNRLKLLYLLTVADISATNPNLWNGWKDSLLRKLYLGTEKALQHNYVLSSIDKKTALKKDKTILRLSKNQKKPLSTTTLHTLWQNWPETYFLHHTIPSIARHTTLVLKQKKGQAVFCFSDHPRHGHYELFIYCQDRSFLFSVVTNILEKENLNVVSADILTTHDGYTLDSFYLLREQGYAQQKMHLITRLETAIQQLEQTNTAPVFNYRFQKNRVLAPMPTEIHCRTQDNGTEIEIITHDRPGLLAKIGLVFATHKLNLQQAKIATLGQRVEDIFKVYNAHQQALSDDEIKTVTQHLLTILDGS